MQTFKKSKLDHARTTKNKCRDCIPKSFANCLTGTNDESHQPRLIYSGWTTGCTIRMSRVWCFARLVNMLGPER